ncbi:MAG: helix-turn-helix transcriptional regulator [Proteobacteria bacterium]|nr:helix-turn-helix transcriptional regulator [Pseudomonadota bacterium]
MSDFAKNLTELIQRLKPRKMEQIAEEIGIDRSTLSRLKNGIRAPSTDHLEAIANYTGLPERDRLLLPHAVFKKMLDQGAPTADSPIHGLRVVARNLAGCKEAEKVYAGQYVLYTPSTRPGKVVASLLEIGQTTSNGLSVNLINPYNGHEGEYLAFEYRGFMVPVAEYLYIFAEQLTGGYEVLSLIFHSAPVAPAQMLEGVQSGVGVIKNEKFIAAVPVVGYRLRNRISRWRDALGSQLGYLEIAGLPEVIRQKFIGKELIISRRNRVE